MTTDLIASIVIVGLSSPAARLLLSLNPHSRPPLCNKQMQQSNNQCNWNWTERNTHLHVYMYMYMYTCIQSLPTYPQGAIFNYNFFDQNQTEEFTHALKSAVLSLI